MRQTFVACRGEPTVWPDSEVCASARNPRARGSRSGHGPFSVPRTGHDFPDRRGSRTDASGHPRERACCPPRPKPAGGRGRSRARPLRAGEDHQCAGRGYISGCLCSIDGRSESSGDYRCRDVAGGLWGSDRAPNPPTSVDPCCLWHAPRGSRRSRLAFVACSNSRGRTDSNRKDPLMYHFAAEGCSRGAECGVTVGGHRHGVPLPRLEERCDAH